MAEAKKAAKPAKAKPQKKAKAVPKAAVKRGRPTKSTPELLDMICQGIAVGKSARAMCIAARIAQPTLWKWLGENETFSKQYARAKEDCADYLAAEIIEIADEGRNDTYMDEDGIIHTDHDVIARSRLRVDARKWYASKLSPKKYGDRTTLAGDADNPLAVLTMESIAANPNSRIKVK